MGSEIEVICHGGHDMKKTPKKKTKPVSKTRPSRREAKTVPEAPSTNLLFYFPLWG